MARQQRIKTSQAIVQAFTDSKNDRLNISTMSMMTLGYLIDTFYNLQNFPSGSFSGNTKFGMVTDPA